MKKYVVFGILVLFLFGSVITAPRAQEMKETTALVSQIKEILNANSMLGKPLEVEGTTIIPIASIFFGFGSGTGSSEQETGTGGGGGGSVMPVGFLVISKEGELKVIEAQKSTLAEIIKAIVPVIMEAMQTRMQMMMEKKQATDTEPAPIESPKPAQNQ
jgi:uncharacterized spore protein YtfJ